MPWGPTGLIGLAAPSVIPAEAGIQMSEVDAMIVIVTADGSVNLVALDMRGSYADPSRVSEKAYVEAAPIHVSMMCEGRRL